MFIKEWSKRQVFDIIVSQESQMYWAPSQHLQYLCTFFQKIIGKRYMKFVFLCAFTYSATKDTEFYFYIFIFKWEIQQKVGGSWDAFECGPAVHHIPAVNSMGHFSVSALCWLPTHSHVDAKRKEGDKSQ